MNDAVKHLETELSRDYDVVVQALGRMTKNIGDHGDEALSESAHAFVHSASSLADKIKNRSAALAKDVGGEIRDHPVTAAALAAAAVGLLGFAVTQATKRK